MDDQREFRRGWTSALEAAAVKVRSAWNECETEDDAAGMLMALPDEIRSIPFAETLVTCVLPRGHEKWRPDPFPGSDEAAAADCSCPLHQPWPGKLIFALDCPVHQLEKSQN
jgi:hypothetical protein